MTFLTSMIKNIAEFYYIKVGYTGVYISRTCILDILNRSLYLLSFVSFAHLCHEFILGNLIVATAVNALEHSLKVKVTHFTHFVINGLVHHHGFSIKISLKANRRQILDSTVW